jgi:hypothetical protein
MALPGAIAGVLSNRLKIADWVKRHPGIADERIEAPVVVIGIFRAGTTLLSYLPEKDPAHRPLFRWEAGDCIPPPAPETIAGDPRIAATSAVMEMMARMDPRQPRGAERGGRRADRMHLGHHPGLQEPGVRGDGQHPDLWRMAGDRRHEFRL